jgi:hypothetical protein
VARRCVWSRNLVNEEAKARCRAVKIQTQWVVTLGKWFLVIFYPTLLTDTFLCQLLSSSYKGYIPVLSGWCWCHGGSLRIQYVLNSTHAQLWPNLLHFYAFVHNPDIDFVEVRTCRRTISYKRLYIIDCTVFFFCIRCFKTRILMPSLKAMYMECEAQCIDPLFLKHTGRQTLKATPVTSLSSFGRYIKDPVSM